MSDVRDRYRCSEAGFSHIDIFSSAGFLVEIVQKLAKTLKRLFFIKGHDFQIAPTPK